MNAKKDGNDTMAVRGKFFATVRASMLELWHSLKSVHSARHCAWANAAAEGDGMLFALSTLPCMVTVQCNFDILNTTFIFLTKLNRGPRCAE
ncbi:MAG: hypothetical protein NTY98_19620 [Verrucomicrobia bacterium]|nr:hypothetical protein [Verrucomicrobiota bacterium]